MGVSFLDYFRERVKTKLRDLKEESEAKLLFLHPLVCIANHPRVDILTKIALKSYAH
jgi:hypothetical protein